jgi:phosphate transport system protein
MIPIEYELDRLKEIIYEMFDLVKTQINESKDALIAMDNDLAESIVRRELRVNALEITIDRECENLLACYSPVAADLRFVMSALKISESLERLSDHAYRIARFVQNGDVRKDTQLSKNLGMEDLFDTVSKMIDNVIEALDKQDTSIAKKTFKLDKIIDKAQKVAPDIIKKMVKQDINHIKNSLYFFSIIGKLERCGDLIKNIAEEIVFYIEAEILKHQKRNKKIRKRIEKVTGEEEKS